MTFVIQRSLISTTVALSLLVAPSFALADDSSSASHLWSSLAPPKCSGHANVAIRSRYLTEGLEHYRRAKQNPASATTEFTAALSALDAACAEGNDAALEIRAYALAGLQHWVEAAESLDAFLALHPLDSLSDELRERIKAQEPTIFGAVATLTVKVVGADSAHVTIDHRDFGMTPLTALRLPAGVHDIEVAPKDGSSQRHTVTLATGPHEETFDFRPQLPPPPPPKGPAGADTGAETPQTSKFPYFPVAIGTGVGAVVLAGAGVGTLLWMNDRASTYNASCLVANPPAACASVLSEHDLAQGFTIGLFIGAGALAVTSTVLFVLHYTSPKAAAPKSDSVWGGVLCAPDLSGGVGLACSGRF